MKSLFYTSLFLFLIVSVRAGCDDDEEIEDDSASCSGMLMVSLFWKVLFLMNSKFMEKSKEFTFESTLKNRLRN